MKHFLPSPWFLFALGALGCVQHAAVEGAACPCPEGYACCATLDTCLPRDAQDDCADQQPASSGSPCQRDADCKSNELCQAWRNADGKIAGPRQCRNTCSSQKPCAGEESCQLVPHDGRPLEDAELARACVVEGAQACDCRACDESQIGRTFCEAGQIKGCFLAFDQACGVTCQQVVVHDCTSTGCADEAQRMACIANADGGGPCWTHACSKCESEPGTLSCQDGQLTSCARASATLRASRPSSRTPARCLLTPAVNTAMA